MNVSLLKLATHRKIGYRAWLFGSHRASYAMPSRNNFGWHHLSWDVEGGKRGLDAMRHRSLARGVAIDLVNGTNATQGMRPLA